MSKVKSCAPVYSGEQNDWFIIMHLKYKTANSLVKMHMIIIIAVSMNTGSRKVKLALTVTLMFIMIMKVTKKQFYCNVG
jgi:hypothetical protein